jgi:antitoxin PrlF
LGWRGAVAFREHVRRIGKVACRAEAKHVVERGECAGRPRAMRMLDECPHDQGGAAAEWVSSVSARGWGLNRSTTQRGETHIAKSASPDNALSRQCNCIIVKAALLLLDATMPSMLTSKVTERSQTTLPPGVRKVLGIDPGDRIGYIIEGNQVRLVNASAVEHADPVIDRFLAFIGRDLEAHPERVRALPESLLKRARSLTRGVAIDHDAPIEGDVGL